MNRAIFVVVEALAVLGLVLVGAAIAFVLLGWLNGQ